jgi:hypothetical protein
LDEDKMPAREVVRPKGVFDQHASLIGGKRQGHDRGLPVGALGCIENGLAARQHKGNAMAGFLPARIERRNGLRVAAGRRHAG